MHIDKVPCDVSVYVLVMQCSIQGEHIYLIYHLFAVKTLKILSSSFIEMYGVLSLSVVR